MRNACLIASLTLLLFYGCKDPYYPEIEPTQTNFLVVEGVISTGDSATQIRLSRSLPIYDSTQLKSEGGALVTVEGEDNSSYVLSEKEIGLYVAKQFNPDPSKKYRLRIRTANGSDYASEYLPISQTPPVDLSWHREDDGVHIDLSSKGPNDGNRYFKWSYEETWEINSHYQAVYKYEDGHMKERDLVEREKMRVCWVRNNPSNINLTSTVALAENLIDKKPVVFIPARNERLDVRYSINVKMQALDKRAYEFYQLMKKNTESLGTLFDPQPSDISGNITCLSNPKEKVVGFVLGTTLQEKRIFISRFDVPAWNYNPGCFEKKVQNTPDAVQEFAGDALIAYNTVGGGPSILEYIGVFRQCADCRIGGTNEKPLFW